MTIPSTIAAFNTSDLIMSAASHYLGRRTEAVSSFCEQLVASWDDVPRFAADYIERIVEEAFQRDDRHREQKSDESCRPLGHDRDRAAWERVRQLWRQ